eukprot:5418782-Amphidinium_carterae.1
MEGGLFFFQLYKVRRDRQGQQYDRQAHELLQTPALAAQAADNGPVGVRLSAWPRQYVFNSQKNCNFFNTSFGALGSLMASSDLEEKLWVSCWKTSESTSLHCRLFEQTRISWAAVCQEQFGHLYAKLGFTIQENVIYKD